MDSASAETVDPLLKRLSSAFETASGQSAMTSFLSVSGLPQTALSVARHCCTPLFGDATFPSVRGWSKVTSVGQRDLVTS